MINIDELPVESSTPGVTSSTCLSVVQSRCNTISFAGSEKYPYVLHEILVYVTGSDLDKENNNYTINEDKSPPISARLRELSNSLRLICSSTPVCLNISESDAPYGLVSSDVMEPQTPTMERSLQVYDEQEVANPTTPWETFSKRSTGLKVRFDNVVSKFDDPWPFKYN